MQIPLRSQKRWDIPKEYQASFQLSFLGVGTGITPGIVSDVA